MLANTHLPLSLFAFDRTVVTTIYPRVILELIQVVKAEANNLL